MSVQIHSKVGIPWTSLSMDTGRDVARLEAKHPRRVLGKWKSLAAFHQHTVACALPVLLAAAKLLFAEPPLRKQHLSNSKVAIIHHAETVGHCILYYTHTSGSVSGSSASFTSLKARHPSGDHHTSSILQGRNSWALCQVLHACLSVCPSVVVNCSGQMCHRCKLRWRTGRHLTRAIAEPCLNSTSHSLINTYHPYLRAASPGRLTAFDEELFRGAGSGAAAAAGSSDVSEVPVVVAVAMAVVEGQRNVGVAFLDGAERKLGMCEFVDDDGLAGLEAVLVQLGAKEVVVMKVRTCFCCREVRKRTQQGPP